MAKYLKGKNHTVFSVLEMAAKAAKAGKLERTDLIEFNKWFSDSKKAIRLDMIEGQLLVRIEGEMEDPERTKKKVEK